MNFPFRKNTLDLCCTTPVPLIFNWFVLASKWGEYEKVANCKIMWKACDFTLPDRLSLFPFLLYYNN